MRTKKTSPSESDLNSIEKENSEEKIAKDNSPDSEADLKPEEATSSEEKDPVEFLKEKLRKKEEELAEQKNEFLRYQAETENFKKRMRKEKEEFARFANEKLLKELLQIKDNLERALSVPTPTIESLKEGVDMILKQFDSFLDKENVEPIAAVGQKFDPSVHEVLCQVESEEHEENTITEEYTKGYHLNGRILRPAKVVVSKLPEKGENEISDKKKPSEKKGETESPASKERK